MVKQNCKQNCGPLPCNLVCYVTEQFGETDFCFFDKRLGRHKKGILSVENQVICCLQATTGEKSKWVAAHTDRWRKGGPKKKSGVDMAVIKQAVETTYITLTQSSGNAVQWCCCFSPCFTYGSYCSLKVNAKLIVQFIFSRPWLVCGCFFCEYFKEKWSRGWSGILAQHNVTEVKSVSKMLLIVFINLMVFLSFDFIDLILHVWSLSMF